MDLILTKEGLPFRTEKAAQMRQGSLRKDGTETKIVEYEGGGFALERLEPRAVEERRQRVPLRGRNRMGMRKEDQDPNFKYYVVNDDPNAPGRVQDFIRAGWEKIPKDEIEGLKDYMGVDVGTDLGDDAAIPVGGGVRGVHMRIRREWWEEDQKKKEEDLLRKEAEIRKTVKQPGHYGKAEFEGRTVRRDK